MWYVIVAGAGVALGLGLLIWGLSERSKRTAAEQAATAAEVKAADAERRLAEAAKTIGDLQVEAKRNRDMVGVLHAEADGLRDVLGKCKDPETIKAWLKDLLDGGALSA